MTAQPVSTAESDSDCNCSDNSIVVAVLVTIVVILIVIIIVGTIFIIVLLRKLKNSVRLDKYIIEYYCTVRSYLLQLHMYLL